MSNRFAALGIPNAKQKKRKLREKNELESYSTMESFTDHLIYNEIQDNSMENQLENGMEYHDFDYEEEFQSADLPFQRIKPVVSLKTRKIDPIAITRFDVGNGKVSILSGGKALMLKFVDSERLYFKGTVQVKVKRGAIKLYGAVLTEKDDRWETAYSLPTHSLLCFQNIPDYSMGESSSSANKSGDAKLDREIEKLMKRDSDKDSTILIIRTFEDAEKYKVFDCESPFPEKMIGFAPVIEPSNLFGLNLDDEWEDLSGKLSSEFYTSNPPVILICGSKNIGKSTSSRYITNTFLSHFERVAFLETDLGQSEFVVPGMVALNIVDRFLLGPPSTHIKSPLTARYVGLFSALYAHEYYIENIESVMQYYNEMEERIPLVINTQGWVEGLGLELLQKITKLANPNLIVKIVAYKDFEPVESYEEFQGEIFVLPGFTARSSHSATERRNDMIRNYFGTYPNLLKPFKIHWSQLRLNIMHHNINACDILKVLNGSLVGLAYDPNDVEFERNEEEELTRQNSLPIILNKKPDNVECLGCGIVRLIDMEEGYIYISTPLDMNSMEKVNTILRGNIDFPAHFSMEVKTGGPYFLQGVLQNSMNRSRVNLPRKFLASKANTN